MAEGGAGEPGEGSTTVQVTVVVCVAPRETREWTLDLPQGASVADALRAIGAAPLPSPAPAGAAEMTEMGAPFVGVWGRAAALDAPLQHGDRVEVYRPLKVDPKVARRERFARQGARSTGLFARQRPGGKSGY